jgi:DedD protein
MTDNERSAKDFNPKHRVIGAIVLVSLGVIFVPMILDERTPPAAALAQLSEIPAPETKILVTDVAQGPEQAAPGSSVDSAPSGTIPVAAAPSPPVAHVDETSTVNQQQKVAAHPAVQPPTKPHVQRAHEDEHKTWFVQVGTFSNGENAKQLANKLKARGFPVHLEKVALADTGAMRVRVGPYTNVQAKQVQTEIKRKVGVNGLLSAD